MASSSSPPPPPAFTVLRGTPFLIPPASETPRELKLLSDIDDQDTLRFYLPMVMFYPNSNPAAINGRETAGLIAGAIAKALVYYYPLAGRLTELGPHRKLAVDCTGEGVLFVEADADVRLEQFIDVPMPPVPSVDELAVDLPAASGGLHHSPLLLFQVTMLACGGFILAVRFHHSICDGPGLSQFLAAVGEFARGADRPSVHPVWSRDLLIAGDPPSITHSHPEYYSTSVNISPPPQPPLSDDLVQRSFFFTNREITVLRSRLPPELRRSSTFDVLAAAVWRSRTTALRFNPDDKIRIFNVLTAYSRTKPWLPAGFYGNAFVFASIETTAGELSGGPLSSALGLIQKAKFPVTKEYMRSLASALEVGGRPAVAVEGRYNAYVAADVTRAQFHEADYGLGKGIFGAPATCGTDWLPSWVLSYFVRYKNIANGDDRIVVPVRLPTAAMQRFVQEMDNITKPASAL